ncbi:MAG: hypothetical protein AAF654_07660 [Myxococcota bacterium]
MKKLLGVLFAVVGVAGASCATTKSDGPVHIYQMKPTLTRKSSSGEYDIYILKRKDGRYAVHVCLNYRETGSRVKRNSCKRNVTRSISFQNVISGSTVGTGNQAGPGPVSTFVVGANGQNPPVDTSSSVQQSVEKYVTAFSTALNGRVEITDLQPGDVVELETEAPEGLPNP